MSSNKFKGSAELKRIVRILELCIKDAIRLVYEQNLTTVPMTADMFEKCIHSVTIRRVPRRTSRSRQEDLTCSVLLGAFGGVHDDPKRVADEWAEAVISVIRGIEEWVSIRASGGHLSMMLHEQHRVHLSRRGESGVDEYGHRIDTHDSGRFCDTHRVPNDPHSWRFTPIATFQHVTDGDLTQCVVELSSTISATALQGLDEYSHVWLIYEESVVPSPPTAPINMTLARLLSIVDHRLHVQLEFDSLQNGTLILDIKPYHPADHITM